jgi:hypothetical protein
MNKNTRRRTILSALALASALGLGVAAAAPASAWTYASYYGYADCGGSTPWGTLGSRTTSTLVHQMGVDTGVYYSMNFNNGNTPTWRRTSHYHYTDWATIGHNALLSGKSWGCTSTAYTIL